MTCLGNSGSCEKGGKRDSEMTGHLILKSPNNLAGFFVFYDRHLSTVCHHITPRERKKNKVGKAVGALELWLRP